MKTTTGYIAQKINIGLLAILASCTTLTSASELAKSRTMVIYSDVAGASEILSAEYDRAIEIILQTRSSGEDKISLLNNLCVAYTLAGKLGSARSTCDRAIAAATESRNYGDWFQRYASVRTMRRYKSRAYANRSIFRMISGDATGAARDWEQVRARDK